VLQRFGFTYSSPQSTRLPTGHSLSAPPSDESVEPSGLYPKLVGCLILRGDFVIHHELALPFLSGLVTSCSPPLCLWGGSSSSSSNSSSSKQVRQQKQLGTVAQLGGSAGRRGSAGQGGAARAAATALQQLQRVQGACRWRRRARGPCRKSTGGTGRMGIAQAGRAVRWQGAGGAGSAQADSAWAENAAHGRLSDGTGIWFFSFPLRLSHGNSASTLAASAARAASRAAASAAAIAAAAAASAAAVDLFFMRLLCLSPPASSTSFAGLLFFEARHLATNVGHSMS
ncbi:unnamed protein product, partial [Closterium sp. NIES-54]